MRDLEEEPFLRNSFAEFFTAEFFTGVFKDELYLLRLFLRDDVDDDFCGDDEEELRLAITRA